MIEKNQLAEILLTDGQPVRAFYNYLAEVQDLILGYECITDYSQCEKTNVHPFIANLPDLKITEESFIDSLICAVMMLKRSSKDLIDLSDLYLEYSYEKEMDDPDYYDYFKECDEESIHYRLKTQSECDDFYIVFNDKKDPPVIGNIEIEYPWTTDNTRLTGKFNLNDNNYRHIWVFVHTGEGGGEDQEIHLYNDMDIKYIVPVEDIRY